MHEKMPLSHTHTHTHTNKMKLIPSPTPSQILHTTFRNFTMGDTRGLPWRPGGKGRPIQPPLTQCLSQHFCYPSGPDYPLCRLYHGRGPTSQGGPRRSAAKFLPRCFDVWAFSVGLKVTTTKKRSSTFFGKKVHCPLRVREKGRRLTLVCPPPNG